MTWFVTEEKSQKELGEAFASLMKQNTILKIVGTHDAMAGIMAKKVGFQALYLSGGALTASKGIPDIGLLNSAEVAKRANEIVRATNLPILADVDDGFGGPLNVARTVKEMVDSKVAAIQIEDQKLPKKCGHLNGKQLISISEMAEKIKIAKKIAPTLVVIARTDAKSVEGLDAAIERAKAYEDAGADGIFPEALETAEEFRAFSEVVKVPLLANMTEFGRTPYFTSKEFEEMGYSMVIYPVTSLRVAAKAYERAFQEIFEKGTQRNILGEMQTRRELYEVIRLSDYEALDSSIAKTVLPTAREEERG